MSASGQPRTALIVGCGYVGVPLAELLHAQGYTCFGLRRDPSLLPAFIRPLRADVTRPEQLALPRSVDCLVYAVGAKQSSDQQYYECYVRGLQNVLGALGQLPRVIFVSSTAVYEQKEGQWVDEDSPAQPVQFAGQRLLQAEAIALTAGTESVVVRAGGIYGPGRLRLLTNVREGRVKSSLLGDEGACYTNRIHQRDLARAIAHLAQLQAPERLYLAVDCSPASYAAVVRWMEQRLGLTPRECSATAERESNFPSSALPPEAEALPATKPAPRRGQTSKRCSSARLQQSGFEFCYPSFREGYEALIQSAVGAP